jgi:hypothetical protein
MATSKDKAPADLKHHDSVFLECRDFMHAWTWQTDFNVVKTQGRITSVTRVVACLRCGTLRADEYEVPSFQRVRSSYTYPDGYLMPGHKGHVPVATIRAEIMRRFRSGAWKP